MQHRAINGFRIGLIVATVAVFLYGWAVSDKVAAEKAITCAANPGLEFYCGDVSARDRP